MKWIVAALIVWALWTWLGRRKPVKRPDDRAAARALLQVEAGADAAAVRAAHRRLVADAHPDRGGSEELTRRLNAARDLLLRG